MEDENLLTLEAEIVKALRTVYDPEIPVNIYDLGLIYDVDIDEYNNVDIKMTLTAPNCPVADDLLRDTKVAVGRVEGTGKVQVELVFDPPWDKHKMSDEAKLELGFM